MESGMTVKSPISPLLLLIILMALADVGLCFPLFGYGSNTTPRSHIRGDQLTVEVDELTSAQAQLPYAYYSLPFCPPATADGPAGFFGDLLGTGRLINSPYVFSMQEMLSCKLVCRMTLDDHSAKVFKEKIHEEYEVNMVLDGLPGAVSSRKLNQDATDVYRLGFSIGWKGQSAGTEDYKYFIHNHLVFTVKYHEDPQTDTSKIVGFKITPFSVKHEYEGEWNEKSTLRTCNIPAQETLYYPSTPQEVRDEEEIIFTYDVAFQESNVTWESRWENYYQTQANQVKSYAAVNSLVILIFLLGLVAIAMVHTYRDISNSNDFDILDETGWKLVSGDVFRRPSNSDLLCVYAGTGIQCFGTVTGVLVLSVIGFISPSNWSEIWKVILFLWTVMGYFAGYISARFYRMFKGTNWRLIALKTAFIFPGPVIIILFILNFLTYCQKSSNSVSCGAMSALILLWLAFSMPLVFTGSYIGFRKQPIEPPFCTNKIRRDIPEQPWYKQRITIILAGGIIPFTVIFYDLLLILASIWLHQFYYITSSQILSFVALFATSAGTAIVFCYIQLCREDYRWWWMSYLTSGFSGLYIFLYATYFFADLLYITKPVPFLLYFGHMLIGSYAFFVLSGAIGFYACFSFTRLIYSSLKND